MRIPSRLALAVILSFGCAEGRGEAKVASTSTTEGDTTLVTITAPESLPALLVPLDSPRVVWTPEELGRPNGLAVGPDGRITVSDRAHIYAWQPGSDSTESISREGAGPGEFRIVSSLLAQPDGSVLVLDGSQRRIVRLDDRGIPDSTWMLAADPAQQNFLAQMDGELVIATSRGLVHTGEPPDTLYLRLGSDTTGPALGSVPLYVWMELEDGTLAPRDRYPRRVNLAGSATAGFAFSDGLQYHIRWWRPGKAPAWLHLSRSWTPPLQSVDREPPGSLLATLRDSGNFVKQMNEQQQGGERKYSIEALALMPGGTLWVRPVDESYVYRLAYYVQLSELRPPTWLWEVYGADGTLRAQVRLSPMFTPRTVHDCKLYGFLEDSDGVYSVATIPLGEACEKLGGS